MCALALLAGLTLAGCTVSLAADSPPPTPTETPGPPTATWEPSPTPTWTPSPTPTPEDTPTPAPTISLGFLTPQAAELHPELATPTPTGTPMPLFPERVVPEPFGVNIHFTREEVPGELDLLTAGGFRLVRMDLFWSEVERERGKYDFSAYDNLVAEMEKRQIRIIFILDYGNDLYGGGPAVLTDEGRAGFARFSATAVKRYRGKGILWEIWNEPNLSHFWHADPNPEQYARMADETITAIRKVDPTAWIIGPATSGFPWPFFEGLAESGLLGRLDAISVHPYRFAAPETAQDDLLRLRTLLARTTPDRYIPILSGEWGYASAAMGISEERQAHYLTRQWLFNLANDVDISIWYDWRNDGLEPDNAEHHFGTVYNDFRPKPAYRAAQTLNTTLKGYRFLRRIPMENPEDVSLLFGTNGQGILVAWTLGTTHTVRFPISCKEVSVVETFGAARELQGKDHLLEMEIGPGPRYVQLCNEEMIQRTVAWRPEQSIVLLQEQTGRVLVNIDNTFYDVLQGEFIVRQGDVILGRAPADVLPGEQIKVSIPIMLETKPEKPIQVQVELVTPDGLPFQSALIWLLAP